MTNIVPLSKIVVDKGLQTGPFGSQLKADEYTPRGIPVVMPKDIEDGYVVTKTITRVPEHKAKKLEKHRIQEGDILFPRRGELGRIAVATDKNNGWICGTGCLRARLIPEANAKYVHQYLLLPQVKQWLESNALGQTMLNLNTRIIGELPINYPEAVEQSNIASALIQWDTAIEKTEALIAAKRKQFDWLTSKTINNAGYDRDHISTFVAEVSTRNRSHDIDRVLSVTNYNGFVLPEKQFKRRVASTDLSNYKVVKQGEYAYNPSRINVGSIARLDNWDVGVLSPMYIVFKLDETKIKTDYFQHWLSSYEARQRIKLSAQGGVRQTVGFGDLASILIPLPDLEKQKHIANLLNTSTNEITILKKLVEKYRTQKCGLMQKLLTGEWRVKGVT